MQKSKVITQKLDDLRDAISLAMSAEQESYSADSVDDSAAYKALVELDERISEVEHWIRCNARVMNGER